MPHQKIVVFTLFIKEITKNCLKVRGRPFSLRIFPSLSSFSLTVCRCSCSLQKQVSVMSMNLSAKLDELQRGDRHLETTVALCEIRTQLQELTKSVESCQSEVSEVKRDMVAIKHELDTVQQVKEEIEELREYVDRLEEHTHRRKLHLLEQVGGGMRKVGAPGLLVCLSYFPVEVFVLFIYMYHLFFNKYTLPLFFTLF